MNHTSFRRWLGLLSGGITAFLVFTLVNFLYAKNKIDQANHPFFQVTRFATDGRAQLRDMKLSTGRSATLTIAALSHSVSPDATKPGFRVIGTDGSYSDNPAHNVLKILVIPHESRGRFRIVFETGDPAIHESVRHAAGFLEAVVSPDWLPRSEIRVRALRWDEDRAFAHGLGGNASIHLQPGVINVPTAIHELAHHIEGDHPFILELSKRFIARRARGGSPERLRDLMGHGYKPDEITLRANWSTRGGSHYVGKFYGSSLNRATATEVISMGLARIYSDPAGFYRQDTDYFLFLLLTLQSQ